MFQKWYVSNEQTLIAILYGKEYIVERMHNKQAKQ
jgi:hypothetical protein